MGISRLVGIDGTNREIAMEWCEPQLEGGLMRLHCWLANAPNAIVNGPIESE